MDHDRELPVEQVEFRPPVRIEVTEYAAIILNKAMQEGKLKDGMPVQDEESVRRFVMLAGRCGLDVYTEDSEEGGTLVTITTPEGVNKEVAERLAAKFKDELSSGVTVEKVESIRRPAEKMARNMPCRCGSGKKFKKCCMRGPKPCEPLRAPVAVPEHAPALTIFPKSVNYVPEPPGSSGP